MRTVGYTLGISLLSFCVGSSDAAVITSNFSAAVGTGTYIGPSSSTISKEFGWTMGATAYNLDKVTLSIDPSSGGAPLVSIWEGTGTPVTQLDILANPTFSGKADYPFTPTKLITMDANKTYWVQVVEQPGGGNFYWDGTSPSTLPSGIATTVGYIWNGNPSSTNNRLEVEGSLASTCSGPAVEYGSGCPGTGGFIPHLSIDNCPIAGSTVQLTLSSALGGSSAIIMLGLGQGAVPIPGTNCFLNLLPLLPMTVLVPIGGSGAGAGTLVLTGALPLTTSGATAYLQFFVIDPGVPHGYTNTNGVILAIQ